MSFTQIDLDAIDSAIKSGKRAVQYNQRRVEYQSLSDMLKARDIIKKEVDDAQSLVTGVNRPRGYRARTSKGY